MDCHIGFENAGLPKRPYQRRGVVVACPGDELDGLDHTLVSLCRDGQGRPCPRKAVVQLLAPDGEPAPGARMCRQHAQECVDEYHEKLGEVWALRKL